MVKNGFLNRSVEFFKKRNLLYVASGSSERASVSNKKEELVVNTVIEICLSSERGAQTTKLQLNFFSI
jgi:hypothetical protein